MLTVYGSQIDQKLALWTVQQKLEAIREPKKFRCVLSPCLATLASPRSLMYSGSAALWNAPTGPSAWSKCMNGRARVMTTASWRTMFSRSGTLQPVQTSGIWIDRLVPLYSEKSYAVTRGCVAFFFLIITGPRWHSMFEEYVTSGLSAAGEKSLICVLFLQSRSGSGSFEVAWEGRKPHAARTAAQRQGAVLLHFTRAYSSQLTTCADLVLTGVRTCRVSVPIAE